MKIYFWFNLLFTLTAFSQEINHSSLLIPEELKENANSVVRSQHIEMNILSQELMTIKKAKIITVLNAKGNNNIDAEEYYDNSTKIKNIEAVIFDAFGKEIKKIKRKDFIDQSVADGFSIYRDNRKLFLEYTPTGYPFTIMYTSEIETSNTAFIPSWFPIDDYYESVQNSEVKINFVADLGFKFKERNFKDDKIKSNSNETQLTYSVQNLKAIKYEELAPTFINNNPYVLFGLDKFQLEGLYGSAKTWEEFGVWVYTNLLKETEAISEATIQKVKLLVGDEKDPIEKAKIIYKYLQERSRYVSIQLGIGGWKPMLATDVDRLGYGDCKALTNYTRVLLKQVGVESYYTLIYAGNDKKSIDKDFVSMQGNHAILSIPTQNGYTSLECTSQTSPFGFNGNFTDDRLAVMIKPNGAELIKTTDYNNAKSKQVLTGNCSIDQNGNLNASIKYVSTGVQYDQKYELENKSQLEKESHYKESLSWLNGIQLQVVKITNDKNNIKLSEELNLVIPKYVGIGNEIMVPVNIFNKTSFTPQRYKVRMHSFEISTGFLDEDEIELELPSGYQIASKPNDITLNDKFGSFEMKLEVISPTKIKYKRMYLLNKGSYPKEEYDAFRAFTEQVVKLDNSKILIRKQPTN